MNIPDEKFEALRLGAYITFGCFYCTHFFTKPEERYTAFCDIDGHNMHDYRTKHVCIDGSCFDINYEKVQRERERYKK